MKTYIYKPRNGNVHYREQYPGHMVGVKGLSEMADTPFNIRGDDIAALISGYMVLSERTSTLIVTIA